MSTNKPVSGEGSDAPRVEILANAPTEQPLNDVELAALERQRDIDNADLFDGAQDAPFNLKGEAIDNAITSEGEARLRALACACGERSA